MGEGEAKRAWKSEVIDLIIFWVSLPFSMVIAGAAALAIIFVLGLPFWAFGGTLPLGQSLIPILGGLGFMGGIRLSQALPTWVRTLPERAQSFRARGGISGHFLQTPAQRIALLSLCGSLLFAAAQVAVYCYYHIDDDGWFWSILGRHLHSCLSLRYTCPEGAMLSRPLMFVTIIWFFVSLVCLLFWRHIRAAGVSIKHWVMRGS